MFLLPLTHLFTHLFLFLIDIEKWRLTSQPLYPLSFFSNSLRNKFCTFLELLD